MLRKNGFVFYYYVRMWLFSRKDMYTLSCCCLSIVVLLPNNVLLNNGGYIYILSNSSCMIGCGLASMHENN